MTTKRIASTTAMALCLAALALPAAAQDAAAGADALYLGRIIIGYTADGTPVYAGDNTSVIEGDSVTAQGGTARIDDVLRQTPGVSSRIDPGNPGVAIAMRGFQGQGRVAASIEGVPQNFRFLGHVAEGYAYVEPMFLKGIDITRGAVVTAGGSGLVGSVNFRMIDADDLVDGSGWGSMVRLSYGSNGDDFSRMVATGYVGESFSMMASIAGNDSNLFEDGAGNRIANSEEDSDSYMIRGEYRIDETQSVDFLALRTGYTFAANSYNQELTSDTFKLGYSLNTGDLINLRVNVFRAGTTNTYFESISTGAAGASTGRVMETITTGIDVTNVNSFSLGSWDVTSTNGFEYSRDKLDGTNTGVNPSDGSSKRLSLFTENVFTNGPWEFTAGLRYNDYRLTGSYDGHSGYPAGVADIDKEAVDPKLTLAYRVNDWLQPYVSIYKTTRMPSLQETLQDSYHPIMPGVAFYLGPNPNLVPEESRGGEIGFNIDRSGLFNPNDRLTARIAYFKLDVDNYIAYVNSGEVPPFYIADLYWYDNIPGTTVSKGLELEASYEAEKVSVAMSYTNSKSTPPAGSEGFILQPRETFSTTVAGHFLSGAMTLGTTYSYTSGGDSLDSGTTIDSYGLWDVFAAYEVSESFRVTAKVSNVSDKDYRPWGSTGKGPGRSLYIGGEIRF